MLDLTTAGLLTSPGPGLLKGPWDPQWHLIQSRLRITQLRAQSRFRTGFPIKPAGENPGAGAVVWRKDTKKSSLQTRQSHFHAAGGFLQAFVGGGIREP